MAIAQQTGEKYAPRKGESDCVGSSLANARQAAHYAALEAVGDDQLNIASSILYYLTRNHCFVDGNKRAGWLAAVEYLACHGLDVEASEHEVCSMCVHVAENRYKREDVIQWFAMDGRIIESAL
jgi:death-on-curing protein